MTSVTSQVPPWIVHVVFLRCRVTILCNPRRRKAHANRCASINQGLRIIRHLSAKHSLLEKLFGLAQILGVKEGGKTIIRVLVRVELCERR